jgi:hypothetical protein
MKRDMDLIRALLLEIEKCDSGRYGDGSLALPIIEGYPEDQVRHHCYLLHEAGMIEGVEGKSRRDNRDGPTVYPLWLSWKGHDFVDAVRSDSLWNRAKSKVKEKIESASFELLFTYVTELGKGMLMTGVVS